MADVFISYSRKDSDFVHRLHDRLAAEGKDVWIDWEDIPPVAEWFGEISAAIEGADTFIFVLSPESVFNGQNKIILGRGHCILDLLRLIAYLATL